jgi:hypothetical protein
MERLEAENLARGPLDRFTYVEPWEAKASVLRFSRAPRASSRKTAADAVPARRPGIIDRIFGSKAPDGLKPRAEIQAYLGNFAFPKPSKKYDGPNSKRVFANYLLQDAPADQLLLIADDLELAPSSTRPSKPPANWHGTDRFRLFVSHIAKDKDKATRLKQCLLKYGIDAFVAHEDIVPLLEWQVEIEKALHAMDAFLAIHTPGFSASIWTQQEIGFAVGKGVTIISFQMGEDPTGFISKQQALGRRGRTAEDIAAEIDAILSKAPGTAAKLRAAKLANGVLPTDDEVPF